MHMCLYECCITMTSWTLGSGVCYCMLVRQFFKAQNKNANCLIQVKKPECLFVVIIINKPSLGLYDSIV